MNADSLIMITTDLAMGGIFCLFLQDKVSYSYFMLVMVTLSSEELAALQLYNTEMVNWVQGCDSYQFILTSEHVTL